MMKDSQLEDILDNHSRALIAGRVKGKEAALTVDAPLALTPLLELAREIGRLFSSPPAPRGDFRRELHQSLIAEARRQQAQRSLALAPVLAPGKDAPWLHDRVIGWISQETATMPVERRWMIGAAAVGSAVSLAGVLAYVLSHRTKAVQSA
jgi:hypothetical protein